MFPIFKFSLLIRFYFTLSFSKYRRIQFLAHREKLQRKKEDETLVCIHTSLTGKYENKVYSSTEGCFKIFFQDM